MQLHKNDPSAKYDALALHASERARARSLLDLLTEANADIRSGVDPQLLEQEIQLKQQINAKESQRLKLAEARQTQPQALALQAEIDSLLTRYKDIQTQIRLKSPRYANLTQPQPLKLQEIQALLDDNTLLLEYFLGEKHSYLWAVTKNSMISYELPKGAELETLAKDFYKQLTNRIASKDKFSKAANSLSQVLLQPVVEQLNQKRLLVVSDGALQYIPFAALTLDKPGNNQQQVSLVSAHEIVNLPSASTLAVLPNEQIGRKQATKTVAIIADPVFNTNDERVKKTGEQINRVENTKTSADIVKDHALARAGELGINLERLPYTREEVEKIMALVSPKEREQALDFQASLAKATNSNLADYKIVHFATHGILNSARPELSGVVLSLVDEQGNPQNGFLRLNDIYNLNLPAELVVLSACQTGLGQEVKGEGLVGLTRGFMYAGAKQVVVSLWSIDDEATSELMERFYRAMLHEKRSPAAALKQAQLEMQQIPQWKAPYYWAAFTIQGDWR
jgi:CHAT domain-containing protein